MHLVSVNSSNTYAQYACSTDRNDDTVCELLRRDAEICVEHVLFERYHHDPPLNWLHNGGWVSSMNLLSQSETQPDPRSNADFYN